MSTDNLMRGDYVLYVDENKKTHIAKVETIFPENCLINTREGNTGDFKPAIVMPASKIFPVEINDKFLKRNGFVVDSGMARLEYKWRGLRRFLCFSKFYNPDTKEFEQCYSVGNGYTKELHLIQHVMRLYEVNEELEI